jgi:hypothetical protein
MRGLFNPLALGQQTAATQWAIAKAAGSKGGKRSAKRRKSRAKAATPKRRKRRASAKPKRLVKGSAAAKRYMASIRRKRRK